MSAADAPLKKRLNIASSASCFPNLAPGRLDMQSFFSTASIPFLRAENMWRCFTWVTNNCRGGRKCSISGLLSGSQSSDAVVISKITYYWED
jgi:hypothetical protein